MTLPAIQCPHCGGALKTEPGQLVGDPDAVDTVKEAMAERDRLRRAIVEHRTTIHNAGTVRVDRRDKAAVEAKRAADARLWASVGLEGSSS